MEINNKDLVTKLKNGTATNEEIVDYLAKNYSVFEIAKELADYLIEDYLCKGNQMILSPRQQQLFEVVLAKIMRPQRSDVGRKPRTDKYLRARSTVDESKLLG